MPDPTATLTGLLDAIQTASRNRDDAEQAYRRAIVHAYEELEAQQVPSPYSVLAAAAGVSRQATREMVERARRQGV